VVRVAAAVREGAVHRRAGPGRVGERLVATLLVLAAFPAVVADRGAWVDVADLQREAFLARRDEVR
jgi:hypothetical protein